MKDVLLVHEELGWRDVLFHFGAGLTSGSVAKMLTAPFDSIAVPEVQPKVYFAKLVQNVVQVSPIQGLNFALKDSTKFFVGTHFQSLTLNQMFTLNMSCGAVAGAVSSTLLYPYVLYKASVSGQSNLVGAYRHFILPAALHRSLYFGFYDNLTLSSNILTGMHIKQPFIVDFMIRLTSAQMASGAATLLTHPFETARQIFIPDSLLAPWQRQYRNLAHCLISVLRTEGLPRLYKGIGAAMMRSLTAPALALVLYDEIKMATTQLDLPFTIMLA
ncbi:hypothetical protein EON65_31595 [archaeon]|nr:MAG: hypothetical protein EON65_31595 [archaeon]